MSAIEPSRRRPRFVVVVGATVGAPLLAGAAGFVVGGMLRGSSSEGPAGEERPAPSWEPVSPPPAVRFVRIDVENVGLELPDTWTVIRTEPVNIEVQDPESGGLLLLRSGTGEQVYTLDAMQEALTHQARQVSASLSVCTPPVDADVPAGPGGGRYFALCAVQAPSAGGPTVSIVDGYFIGLTDGGRTIFIMRLTASEAGWSPFNDNILELTAPTWHLLSGASGALGMERHRHELGS